MQVCPLLRDGSLWHLSTGLAVGLDPEGYGNPDFCWLSIYDTLIWSFAGPIVFAVAVGRGLLEPWAELKEGGGKSKKTQNVANSNIGERLH